MELDVAELSRLQFAMTAMYHFVFVPLTLGLSIIVVIMEIVNVMTGRPIWRRMTKFWGTLFGINFVLGVATGITMEVQFGMNWSCYAPCVGDIFGAPLAIEGLMAFFLGATFVGLFLFGRDKHLLAPDPVHHAGLRGDLHAADRDPHRMGLQGAPGQGHSGRCHRQFRHCESGQDVLPACRNANRGLMTWYFAWLLSPRVLRSSPS